MEKQHKREILFIRIGLAAVFLTNAITAGIAPGEFTDLVDQSFISSVISSAVALKIILINDSLMTLLILFMRKWQKAIFIWAMVWLSIVLFVTGEPLDILEKSSFLMMALALYFHAYKTPNEQIS